MCILNRPDPITFFPLPVDTSGRILEFFLYFLFFHVHRESSVLNNEQEEESDQFRFLRATRLDNLKGSVGLIMAKVGHEDFYTDWSFLSVFYTSVSFHSFLVTNTVFSPLPRPFPSTFCLIGTFWVFLFAFHSFFYSS
jgi:hypothetical protein